MMQDKLKTFWRKDRIHASLKMLISLQIIVIVILWIIS